MQPRIALLFASTLAACAGASRGPGALPQPPAAPSVVAAIATTAPAPSARADIATKIDSIFGAYADRASPAPGCAVGVYRAGTIAFAKGYGFATLEHAVPITPSTTFEIASMSKQFTATAILLLAQDGKLSLDDDVRKYVPELPVYGKPITLRHLLHHTGGLREYDVLLDLSGYDIADVAPEDDALHLVSLQRGVNFPAGTEFSYSNTGYFLLSYVVRRVSGQSLAAFTRARIFGPLGMKDSSIFDDHTMVVPRRATGYTPRDGGGFAVAMSNREEIGEGNVQSTIEDLARWDANFYEPKVGGRAWLDAMRTPGTLDDGTPLDYATGLVLQPRNGLATEWHNGGWAGYLGDILRVPSERLTVAVLCNRDDVDPNGLADAVLDAAMGKTAEPPPQTPATATTATPTGPAPVLAEGALASAAGAYVDPESLAVRTLVPKDGRLWLGAGLGPGGPPLRALEALDARSFRMPGASSRWTFEPADGQKPARIVRTAPHEKTRAFDRFVPAASDPAKMADYVGRYTSDETTHDLQVAVVDGKLVAGAWGKRLRAPLAPLRVDVFVASGGGLGLAFERGPSGRVAAVVGVFDGHHAVRWTRR